MRGLKINLSMWWSTGIAHWRVMRTLRWLTDCELCTQTHTHTHTKRHRHWGTINMELGYAKVPELFSTLFLWFNIHIFGSAHNRFALSVQWASLGFRESNFQVTRLLFSSFCSYNVYTVIKSRHGHLQLLTNTAAVWNWDSHNTKQHNTTREAQVRQRQQQHNTIKAKAKAKPNSTSHKNNNNKTRSPTRRRSSVLPMLLLFLFFSFGLYVSLFYVAAVLLHPHTNTGTHTNGNANAAVFVAMPVARAIQTVCSSFAVCSPVHCSRCALSALGTCTLNERRCLTETETEPMRKIPTELNWEQFRRRQQQQQQLWQNFKFVLYPCQICESERAKLVVSGALR